MELNSYIEVQQKQTLSAGQVQALNILAFTNQELEDFMVNEYLENPILERSDQKENEIMTSMEKFSDSQAIYGDQHPGSPEEEEPYRRELSAREGNRLKENLLGQLNWKDYSKEQWKIMSYLVDCLDEKGFLLMIWKSCPRPRGTKRKSWTGVLWCFGNWSLPGFSPPVWWNVC